MSRKRITQTISRKLHPLIEQITTAKTATRAQQLQLLEDVKGDEVKIKVLFDWLTLDIKMKVGDVHVGIRCAEVGKPRTGVLNRAIQQSGRRRVVTF